MISNVNISFLVIFAVIGYVSAVSLHHYHELGQHEALQHKAPPVAILKQDFQQSKDGYKYSYETENGIHVQESGYIKNLGDKKHENIVQQGTITYHDEHGRPITLSYVADEHGFRPQGAHLPTPPPIPDEIRKSLQHQTITYQKQDQQQLDEEEYDLHSYKNY